ncbi:FAD-binding protein [Methyloraptor flagellatus]|uniref:FAD-binding protein n=2 Tax=Methyloraptor flagellatus TaxID=3162530 RepID=A0AAU7X555_9HYPH
MTEHHRPETTDAVRAIIRDAVAARTPLEVVGRGTKRGLGRPVQAAAVLDTTGLAGIALYEPDELVLQAGPGTPLAEIEALAAAHGQELAFEPADYGPLYGLPAGQGTFGGAIGVNIAGPRRLSKGAARDHILGITAVTGGGEVFKSGGRVVKNVTGYDLAKLLTGAHGTLGVLTSITCKILPRPETSTTIIVAGLDDARAAEAMSAAMGSPTEVSAAAHLPAPAAAGIAEVAGLGRAATCLRLEGIPVSVAERADRLSKLLAPFGTVARLAEEPSKRLWTAIRDVRPFWPTAGATEDTAPLLWRLSLAPMAGAVAVAAVRARLPGAEAFYDWQGGLVWLAVPADTPDAGAAIVRAAVRAAGGGHATLVRAPAAVRATVAVFEPQSAALAALSARVRQAFDPETILNPGRMAASN